MGGHRGRPCCHASERCADSVMFVAEQGHSTSNYCRECTDGYPGRFRHTRATTLEGDARRGIMRPGSLADISQRQIEATD